MSETSSLGRKERLRKATFKYSAKKIKESEWLWEGWIEKGEVTLVAGRGKIGKGWVTADIVGKLINNKSLFEQPPLGEELKALLISFEDDPEKTIKNRMIMHLGHSDRNLFGIDTMEFNDLNISNEVDYEFLNEFIKENNIDIVVIDPIKMMLKEVDDTKELSVLSGMKPFYSIARNNNISVLGILHTRKSGDPYSIQADDLMGSNKYVNQARAIIGFEGIRDEEGREEKWARIKLVVGNNTSGIDKNYEFRITKDGNLEYREATIPIHEPTRNRIAKKIKDLVGRATNNNGLSNRDLMEVLERMGESPNAIRTGKEFAEANGYVERIKNSGGTGNTFWKLKNNSSSSGGDETTHEEEIKE